MEFVKNANIDITNKKPDHTIVNVFDHSRLVLSDREQELQKLNDISKGCMWCGANRTQSGFRTFGLCLLSWSTIQGTWQMGAAAGKEQTQWQLPRGELQCSIIAR